MVELQSFFKKYDMIGDVGEGRAWVYLNNKWGFLDADYIEVIAPKYDYIGYFQNGKANIQIGDVWGQVDLNGKEYFSPEARTKLRKDKIQRLLEN
jgi:hypothetical protein